jgi:lipopolysaccharide heptosyltransferase II
MNKILIIQTAFIGDAVLTLPMIQKLKEIFVNAELHLLCIPSTSEIFSASPYVKKVLVYDKRDRDKSLLSLFRLILKVRSEKYSRIYSPHRSFRTSLIVKFSGVKLTFGFDNSSLRNAYKYLVCYEKSKHEVQRNLDLIGFSYNSENWKIKPELNFIENSPAPLEKLFVNCRVKSKYIVVAPGSMWNTKKYPAEFYLSIIKYLVSRKYFILLMGGEKDQTLCQELASGFIDEVKSVAGKFSLIESVSILSGAEILISNDSAPTHLGMCADIPVLTIYCSTVPDFGFYPYNSTSSYISYNDLECKPCGIHGHDKCPVNTFDCAHKLKPDMVISKIEEMLNGR